MRAKRRGREPGPFPGERRRGAPHACPRGAPPRHGRAGGAGSLAGARARGPPPGAVPAQRPPAPRPPGSPPAASILWRGVPRPALC